MFWETLKRFLSDKAVNINKITLIKNNQVISEDKKLGKHIVTLFKKS